MQSIAPGATNGRQVPNHIRPLPVHDSSPALLLEELHVTPPVVVAAATVTRAPVLLVTVYLSARVVVVVQCTGLSKS